MNSKLIVQSLHASHAEQNRAQIRPQQTFSANFASDLTQNHVPPHSLPAGRCCAPLLSDGVPHNSAIIRRVEMAFTLAGLVISMQNERENAQLS